MATTNNGPPSADSAFTACDTGSTPSDAVLVPRLIDTTSTPSSRAHCMPSMIADSVPSCGVRQHLPTYRAAPGATPFFAPSEAAPDPAMVDATWVPCPTLSSVLSPGTKLLDATMAPLTSGCVASMPVSRTATLLPVPSKPSAQASGARTCGTDSLSVGSIFLSSHSLPIPVSASRDRGAVGVSGVMPAQKARARLASVFRAVARTAARARTRFDPAGAPGRAEDRAARPSPAPFGAVAISGVPPERASS